MQPDTSMWGRIHAGHIHATQSRSMQVTSLRLIRVHASHIPATNSRPCRSRPCDLIFPLPGHFPGYFRVLNRIHTQQSCIYLSLKESRRERSRKLIIVDHMLFACPQRFTSFPHCLRQDSSTNPLCRGANFAVSAPLCRFLQVFPLQNTQTLQLVK
jgi:hypothetical protein